MTGIVLNDFMGMMPKMDPRSLPGQASQIATNCKLWSGAIDPIKRPLVVSSPTKSGTLQSMYRMDDREGGSDFWLHWPFEVDAIRGAVVDTRQRLLYTGEYEPRVCTFEMAAQGTDTVDGADIYPSGYGESGTDYPLAFYALGVPVPITKGRVTGGSGGAGADEDRAYVYTFTNKWGEESGPSVPFFGTHKLDDTWALELPDTAPLNTGNVVDAVASTDEVTVYTDTINYFKKGHRIILDSVAGMTDLDGEFTVKTAVNLSIRTVSRERATNVVTLVLDSVDGLATGDTVVVSGVGGSDYNGTVEITDVDTDALTIEYTKTGGDEATTADTAGIVQMGKFTVSLTTVQTYTSGGTWARQAPWNVSGLKKRIYRTLTGTAETIYLFVDEISAATTTYSDDTPGDQLLEELTTQGYDVPPGDMHSITAMANGMSAGAYDNVVAFAAPYKPYAWVAEWNQPINYTVVGLASFGEGQILAIMTNGKPYQMTGVHPSAITSDDVESIYPCVSKRGILSLGWSVAYPTSSGLVILYPGLKADLVTLPYYSRKEWDAYANGGVFGSSMLFDNRYYAFWINESGNGESIIFDPAEPQAVITQNNEKVTGAWNDPEDGSGYVIDSNGDIGLWDADDAQTQVFQWKSKEFRLSRPVNLGVAKIEGRFTQSAEESAAIDAANDDIITANAALISSIPSTAHRAVLRGALGAGAIARTYRTSALTVKETVEVGGTVLQKLINGESQFIQFEVIANGVSKYTRSCTQNETFPLPDGYKSDIYSFNLTGNVRALSVKIADTARNLKNL